MPSSIQPCSNSFVATTPYHHWWPTSWMIVASCSVLTLVAGDMGTRVFVLVSTDKAVAPATVMGASKALAEWAVEAVASAECRVS